MLIALVIFAFSGFALPSLALPSLPSGAPSAETSLRGNWITPDKSIVAIYPCDSALCLRIARVDPSIPHTTDGQNPDPALRKRPLCGLVIGTGFSEKDATHAEGGKLYDPESGKTYSGTLTLSSGDTLRLRGFVGVALFGRSETWHRTSTAQPACQ